MTSVAVKSKPSFPELSNFFPLFAIVFLGDLKGSAHNTNCLTALRADVTLLVRQHLPGLFAAKASVRNQIVGAASWIDVRRTRQHSRPVRAAQGHSPSLFVSSSHKVIFARNAKGPQWAQSGHHQV